MKSLLIILLTLLLLPFVFAWVYRWDSAQNRGREVGYYGEFNRISNALASVPGVVITQHWHNRDVTLEEFGFGLTFSGRALRLGFEEKDPIRDWSRKEAVKVLKRRMETKLSPGPANK